MAVPKTAVNEYRGFPAEKHEVRRTQQFFAIAQRFELRGLEPPKDNFLRLGAGRFDRSHDLRPYLSRRSLLRLLLAQPQRHLRLRVL